MSIRFGNAPCSWGTIEGWGQGVGYAQMLDELKATGYTGTELGDYGYMPTDPDELREALTSRGLTMLSAYEGVYLRDAAAHAEGEARVLRTARLLKSVADVGDSDTQPTLMLADEHSRDAGRFEQAGRITPELSLSLADWKTFASGAERIARAVLSETGLRTVFHHHCGGYVEAPWEIEEFLSLTDPGLIDLCFDTGHYLFGTGSTHGELVLDGLELFKERIGLVHFKDCSPAVAERVRDEGLNYKRAISEGVFCELGRGSVDFGMVTGKLVQQGYNGWITVEQDVLPGMGNPEASARHNRDHLRAVTGL
jgi:inosose dehydratase